MPEEKEHILEEEYGISMEMKTREELEVMCNWTSLPECGKKENGKMRYQGKEYNRIILVGNSGSGKSWTAERMEKITGMPVIYLDKECWQSGWKYPPKEEWEANDKAVWYDSANKALRVHHAKITAETLK